MIKAILFDLDGTFVDTAFDLIGSANQLYLNHQKKKILYEQGREIASDGVKAFLKIRFNQKIDDFDLLSDEFLDIYNQKFLDNPLLFDGILKLIAELEGKEILWGVVTNKARRFVENILRYHHLDSKCSVLMCGDDDFKPKPAPDLLIEACRVVGLKVSNVIYVGDGHRDIVAAKSANISSVLACYGYLKKTDSINEWRADYVIQNPLELVNLL
jgi:phosphoglycolate phosphatase-like HAD superfamily hydrolase